MSPFLLTLSLNVVDFSPALMRTLRWGWVSPVPGNYTCLPEIGTQLGSCAPFFSARPTSIVLDSVSFAVITCFFPFSSLAVWIYSPSMNPFCFPLFAPFLLGGTRPFLFWSMIWPRTVALFIPFRFPILEVPHFVSFLTGPGLQLSFRFLGP